ncbi:T9SS type A sorting domain-containing protein [Parabacteroides gordonii]|uniref:Por secretion system C-terminal sorting domain-containing protein n=1 Tax=Parabacteroides gordonii MS-1 = DSM 23371 TaxID=1203610 RepID=A0A0F5JLQ2_9BACT|nr:T9SS type A sorting domain-containing protein [Parabacteroides gordonii]KKB58629.1 por secretion system C-terminal sorting domain-containing protein [Parabacteroides gordonii MS-1 = DSM 23371]MCA5583111.1 T9SS type A sorting domain-containing protein [Parabacteroides gordonii]RGP17243.1 T9SS C-terminal target domain-containing protein [Parabacteroides gordonii]
MKKKHLRMFRRILAGTAILTVLVPVRAQVSNPSEWSGFVKGSGNTVVVDTFRMQTFSGAAGDNWEYTGSDGVVIEKGRGLKIPLKGKVSFEPYTLESFQRVSAVITLFAHSIVAGDTLFVELDNKNGKNRGGAVYPQGKDKPVESVRFGSNPYRLDFFASTLKANTQGYFLIDSIYAKDTIPRYSLFSGTGNWNDKSCWSHLPPFRHRRALINGVVEINSLVQCNQASLADGRLHITDNGHFIVDELFLHNTDISLTVAGELTVNKQITIYYTFPEKGKWHFLSFPFDVSLKGLDPRFELKDDTFSGNGNYLYVQTYNSDKRASSQQATGNWEVFPMPSSLENPFIFEKGKGYLVALDATASDNTLTFSVDKENIPDNFGKGTSIPINISSSGDANSGHSGWYLCGNPLPEPLELSRIKLDPALDGNIYLYDGNTYKPYPIGSNYALPPLAAFFVKATAATELTITGELSEANVILLKSDFSLRSELAEPTEVKTQISQVEKETGKSFIKGNTLYLEDLPSAGKVKVIDVAGRVVYSRAVSNRSSVLPLSLRSGLYIIIVEAGGYRAQHKCVLTQ